MIARVAIALFLTWNPSYLYAEYPTTPRIPKNSKAAANIRSKAMWKPGWIERLITIRIVLMREYNPVTANC